MELVKTTNEAEEIKNQEPEEITNDELEQIISERMRQLQRQNLLLGAQSMCKVILDKIYVFERKPGNKSTNDFKRILKDIKKFCETGLSRKVETDGETTPINEEETVQN